MPLGYSLWLEPEPSFAAPLRRIIDDLSGTEATSPAFDPHVTLAHPISLDESVETIERVIKEALQEVDGQALDLELQPAENGETYYQSVLAPVRLVSQLTKLRKACMQAFGIESRKAYSPHLSLLYGDLTDTRRRELAGLVNEPSPFPSIVRFDRISIVSTVGLASEWQVVGQVKL